MERWKGPLLWSLGSHGKQVCLKSHEEPCHHDQQKQPPFISKSFLVSGTVLKALGWGEAEEMN